MKKFTLFIVVIATILFLTGCENNLTSTPTGEGGLLYFNVNNAMNSKAITPDFDMGVVKIRISGVSQDYATAKFSFEYDYPAGSPTPQEGLYIGMWDIIAEGLNAAGDTAGEDSVTQEIRIDQSATVNLEIKPVVGKGNLFLSYDNLLNGLDLSNLQKPANVRVVGSYTRVGGEAKKFSGDPAVVGSGEISRDNLELELADATFTDTSGNSHTVVNVGATVVNDTTFGDVYDFQGGTDRIELDFKPVTVCTLSYWMKPNMTVAGGIFGTGGTTDGGKSGWAFSYIGSSESMYFQMWENNARNSERLNTEDGSVPNNVWSHITMILNNLDMDIYINGEHVAHNTLQTPQNIHNRNLMIGRHFLSGAGASSYNGMIAKPRIHNRVLSDEEITQLFNRNVSVPELTGQIHLNNLNTGWYDLTLQIKTGGIPLSDPIQETFRIVKDQNTEATLMVSEDELYVGAAGFSVEVNMDNEIVVALATETVGDIVTITATTTDSETGEILSASLTWFLNGYERQETGSSISFDKTTAANVIEGLRTGYNKVTCRAELDGALGNEDVSFIVE